MWWKRSSLGRTSAAVTFMAITTGDIAVTQKPTSGSALCAEPLAPTCLCGWVAKQAFTWMLVLPLMLSLRADTCALRSLQNTGLRSRCLMVLTHFTLPALFAQRNCPGNTTASSSFFRVQLTDNHFAMTTIKFSLTIYCEDFATNSRFYLFL